MFVDNYLAMGKVHTLNYKEIYLDEVHHLQWVLIGHCSAWSKITVLGSDWEHKKRVRKNPLNHSEGIASMYLTVKDHKEIKPETLPKTKPIVSS